jgi:hypothetical protein
MDKKCLSCLLTFLLLHISTCIGHKDVIFVYITSLPTEGISVFLLETRHGTQRNVNFGGFWYLFMTEKSIFSIPLSEGVRLRNYPVLRSVQKMI